MGRSEHSGQRNRMYSGLCQLSESRTPSQNKKGTLVGTGKVRGREEYERVGKVARESHIEF